MDILKFKNVALFAGGVLFGTAGVKLLSSRDAKNVYVKGTAAVLRAKDCLMKTAETVQENAEDILAEAKQINEDVPMIFLYAQDREIMCNPKLENFDPYTFNIFCDIWEWDFAQ